MPKANIYTNQGDHALQKESSATASSSFKVVSVSLGAMKFVTLETGERVFEGGELPGGYLLERIAIDALTLVKNSKTTQYPLRGSSE
jgi:type III secretion protein D